MLSAAAVAHALGLLLQSQQLGLGFDAQVQIEPLVTIEPGAAGELSLTITQAPAEGGWLLVRLQSATVTLRDSRLDARDVVDPLATQPRLRARFVAPTEPGQYEVNGWVEYVTCREQRCRPHRGRVVWAIEVVAPVQSEAASEPDES